MLNISRVIYNPDLNKVHYKSSKDWIAYLIRYPPGEIIRILRHLFSDISLDDDSSDLILKVFMADRTGSRRISQGLPRGLSIAGFPIYGSIKNCSVNPDRGLFSNAHNSDADPVILKELYDWTPDCFLDPKEFAERQSSGMYIPKRRGGRLCVTNLLEGVVLFKRDPFKHSQDYETYDEILDPKIVIGK